MAIPTTTTLYGRLIPPSAKNEVSLKTSKVIGFKYPFLASPGNGHFSKSSGLNLVKTQINNLIKTERGERFMLPDYGCKLRRFLMEPIDEFTFNEIKDDIKTSLGKYLKKVKINKLQVFESRSNGITVKLFCAVKDSTVVNFDVGVDI